MCGELFLFLLLEAQNSFGGMRGVWYDEGPMMSGERGSSVGWVLSCHFDAAPSLAGSNGDVATGSREFGTVVRPSPPGHTVTASRYPPGETVKALPFNGELRGSFSLNGV